MTSKAKVKPTEAEQKETDKFLNAALNNCYEPRRKFRWILEYEPLPAFQAISVDLASEHYIRVQFYDNEDTLTFERLLQCMYDKKKFVGKYKTLGTMGQLFSTVNLGELTIIDVKPMDLDYAENDPIKFQVTLVRKGDE